MSALRWREFVKKIAIEETLLKTAVEYRCDALGLRSRTSLYAILDIFLVVRRKGSIVVIVETPKIVA